jgi:dephospho-CoA kinase
MRVVGLTGGIGTGKSTVGERLRARGVPVLDADQVARAVVAPGEPALAEIAAAFGPDALDDHGGLNRAAMRARIARDPAARRTLEAITHPRIQAETARWLAAQADAGHTVAVVEAALLVETGSYRLYPELVVVSCAPEVQVARVMARDGQTEAQARALLGAQLPLADKEAVATVILRNDGDRAALESQVDALLQRWARAVAQGT